MLDLPAEEPEEDAGDDDVRISLDEARAFYREHVDEIVARMRKPPAPTNNFAALIVAQCETDPRLRNEALKAVETARRARGYAPRSPA